MNSFKINETQKIAPGFSVPDGYFEQFQASMLERMAHEPKVIQFVPRKAWWYAAAGVLALALSVPAIKTIASGEKSAEVAALDNYFANVRLSDDQIVELLDTDDIEKIKMNFELEDAVVEDVLESGTIENYILD